MVLVKQADGHRNTSMTRFLNSPILFFVTGCVIGFDIVLITRAIFG